MKLKHGNILDRWGKSALLCGWAGPIVSTPVQFLEECALSPVTRQLCGMNLWGFMSGEIGYDNYNSYGSFIERYDGAAGTQMFAVLQCEALNLLDGSGPQYYRIVSAKAVSDLFSWIVQIGTYLYPTSFSVDVDYPPHSEILPYLELLPDLVTVWQPKEVKVKQTSFLDVEV